MDFNLTVNMDNAAFENNPGMELAKSLRRLAKHLEAFSDKVDEGRIMDTNGNTVGKWEVTL